MPFAAGLEGLTLLAKPGQIGDPQHTCALVARAAPTLRYLRLEHLSAMPADTVFPQLRTLAVFWERGGPALTEFLAIVRRTPTLRRLKFFSTVYLDDFVRGRENLFTDLGLQFVPGPSRDECSFVRESLILHGAGSAGGHS